jgi:hypothetical protein
MRWLLSYPNLLISRNRMTPTRPVRPVRLARQVFSIRLKYLVTQFYLIHINLLINTLLLVIILQKYKPDDKLFICK